MQTATGESYELDVETNNLALENNGRLMSSYPFDPKNPTGQCLWIITEADRSSTTVLLPEDY